MTGKSRASEAAEPQPTSDRPNPIDPAQDATHTAPDENASAGVVAEDQTGVGNNPPPEGQVTEPSTSQAGEQAGEDRRE